MDKLDELHDRLDVIERQISDLAIDSKTFEAVNLIAERSNLAKMISKVKWDLLSDKEKNLHRLKDFELTEKYYNKYGEDVKPKYLFKKKYIELVEKVSREKSSGNSFISILYSILSLSIYTNSHERDCLKIIIKEISKNADSEELKEIIHSYNELELLAKDFYKNTF